MAPAGVVTRVRALRRPPRNTPRNMNIDIHIIIKMNIEDYKRYYLLIYIYIYINIYFCYVFVMFFIYICYICNYTGLAIGPFMVPYQANHHPEYENVNSVQDCEDQEDHVKASIPK